MCMFFCQVCLVLGAISVEAEVILGLPNLYNNYHGEYAATYDNYVSHPSRFHESYGNRVSVSMDGPPILS